MNPIEEWDNKDSELIREMSDFESNWKHENPCEEYVKSGYCVHLEKAQGRKFKNRVRVQINTLSSLIKT